jgi:hypothetical protein
MFNVGDKAVVIRARKCNRCKVVSVLLSLRHHSGGPSLWPMVYDAIESFGSAVHVQFLVAVLACHRALRLLQLSLQVDEVINSYRQDNTDDI